MNVLIVPEDFRNDQYLLKPLFARLFSDLGRPRVHLRICNNPLLGGVNEALKSERLASVIELYPTVDLFILCIDRDGNLGRRDRLRQIEAEFTTDKRAFFAQCAWEELETWILAGLQLPASWAWSEIRQEVSVKEAYFERLARLRKVDDGPGKGRRALGEEAARHVDAILLKCKEDFGELALRIRELC